jgi:hypothetical protein
MFAHRIFVCFLALIIALAGFSLSDSSAYARELTVPDAKELTAPDEIQVLSNGCSASLWAPWRAGTFVRSRVRVNCPTVQNRIQVGGTIERNSHIVADQWVVCNNSSTCTITVQYSTPSCLPGNYRSTGWGVVNGNQNVNPSPSYSPLVYLGCP